MTDHALRRFGGRQCPGGPAETWLDMAGDSTGPVPAANSVKPEAVAIIAADTKNTTSTHQRHSPSANRKNGGQHGRSISLSNRSMLQPAAIRESMRGKGSWAKRESNGLRPDGSGEVVQMNSMDTMSSSPKSKGIRIRALACRAICSKSRRGLADALNRNLILQ